MLDRGVKIINAANAIGRNLIQVRAIRLSYRIRGRVARTQINKNATVVDFSAIIRGEIKVEKEKAIKKVVVRILIIIILIYSAIKIKANDVALYSILKPETSSDSPSAKSKGVRLVSASREMNHIIPRIGARIRG